MKGICLFQVNVQNISPKYLRSTYLNGIYKHTKHSLATVKFIEVKLPS